jgi:glutathione peroxidase
LIALTVLLSFRPSGDIYSIAVKDLDGNNIELNQYKGKKILFVVLSPSGEDATITVNQIAQLQDKYRSSLVVIGVPSIEAGFKAADADKLKMRYKDAHIILTEGMKVKKGAQQSALFQWLTSKDENHHFNQDVQGTGAKFFVDEGGDLYAVMGTTFSLTHPLMDKILTKPQRKNP